MTKKAKGFGSFDIRGMDEDTLTIAGKRIRVRVGSVPHADLQFFVENPRVHSLLRADGSEPTQEEIQEQLQTMEHVRELIQDIKRNGGLIDALTVSSESREVIEGNSRLAAYRCLALEDPIKWGLVKVVLLPEPVERVVVDVLLGQYHLKGKKEWPPYEQAGYLYRRVTNHGMTVPGLASELGLSKKRITQMIETYAFMVECKDIVRERWSYYDEFIKSRKIAKAREKFPRLDRVVVKMIQGGEIPRAQDLRDKLPVICASSGKTLERFASGKLDFDEAFDLAEDGGGKNTGYLRLKKFRTWLAGKDEQDKLLDAPPAQYRKVAYEIKHLGRLIERLEKRLD